MKRIYYILITLIGLFTISSCTEEIDPVIDSYDFKAPVFDATLPGSAMVLTKATENNVIRTFAWTRAYFGYQSAVTYTLQFDKAGNNFKAPLDVAVTNGLTKPMTVAELNTKLLTLGLAHSRASVFEARVVATCSPLVETLYSAKISFTVTPYEVVIIYPAIYVPGNYQAASGYTSDWSPDKAPALYSLKGDNRYEGYVNFANAGGMYKFTKDQNWTTNWGDDAGNGKLNPNGKDIPSAGPGYYKINVNLNTLAYTVIKTDWGVIGDATPTGWDSDTKLTYNIATKQWTTTLNLKSGGLKFRANSDWALNYGDNAGNFTLQENGANISIAAAGNYTITLDFSKANYTYNLKKN